MPQQKKLKVIKEDNKGLNTEFVNINSSRTFTLPEVIEQIKKGNPTYSNYEVINSKEKRTYIRSKADDNPKNNIE